MLSLLTGIAISLTPGQIPYADEVLAQLNGSTTSGEVANGFWRMTPYGWQWTTRPEGYGYTVPYYNYSSTPLYGDSFNNRGTSGGSYIRGFQGGGIRGFTGGGIRSPAGGSYIRGFQGGGIRGFTGGGIRGGSFGGGSQ